MALFMSHSHDFEFFILVFHCKNSFYFRGGDSLVVGCPLTTHWVAGSNPVDGKSLNESLEICLCSGIRLVVSGYSDENWRSCKQELA